MTTLLITVLRGTEHFPNLSLFAKHLKILNLILISNVFNTYLFESELLTKGQPQLNKEKPRKFILYLEKCLRKDVIKEQRKTINNLYAVVLQSALNETLVP